jgi:2-polyprenyl-3-methyl-5-hydroxy-6-metoxy-1,4-benzoquinol methylase
MPYKMSRLKAESIMRDSIGWDFENWKQSIHFFEKHIKLEKSMKVLELGAGASSGGYSHYLASKGINVICSDFPEVYESAIHFHKKARLERNISYQGINALNISYKNEFDVIIFKSILGGIGRWGDLSKFEDVIDNVYKALKPQGYMLFAENLKSTFIHEIFRNIFGNGKKGWTYINLEEYENIVKKYFSTYNMDTTGFLGCFGQTEFQRSILGKIDQKIFKNIIPKKFNYILFCSAQKAPN